VSRCLIGGCDSTPTGFSASGLCPVHHEAAIRLRLVVPGARASANALRVILAVELAERCRREHAALPEMHERLRQADRRVEEQAAEIGTLRALLAEEQEVAARTGSDALDLRGQVRELERLLSVATVEREEEIARTMLSLQDLREQAQQRQEATICRMSDRTVEKMAETRTRLEEAVEQRVAAEAERDALREQLVAAERRVKGAEAEAATLRRLRGAPAPEIGRRPADSGRRVL
jgi:myosin heavy subunit